MALKTKKENEETGAVVAELVTNEEPVKEETVENTDVAVVDNQNLPDYAILNPDIPMRTKMAVATDVANCLHDLIQTQGLVKKGLNKSNPEAEYVLVEGWEVLGTMLGIVPVTEVVEEMKNDKGRIIGFKARATLYQNPVLEDGKVVDGTVLSTAEAYATRDGFQKEYFSMASMSQTRALGKAYRMALSWIIKMAGFEPTPAEEMPKFKGGK